MGVVDGSAGQGNGASQGTPRPGRAQEVGRGQRARQAPGVGPAARSRRPRHHRPCHHRARHHRARHHRALHHRARHHRASTTEPATIEPATTGPEGRRPAALRLAAAAQLIEALGLGVAAVFGAISTAEGKSHQLTAGVALTLLALGTAAGLAAIAVGLAKARPWSRIPAVMTQVFVVIAGTTLLDGNRPEWGVPALVLAGACVAGLLTPASLRALNRPPVNRR